MNYYNLLEVSRRAMAKEMEMYLRLKWGEDVVSLTVNISEFNPSEQYTSFEVSAQFIDGVVLDDVYLTSEVHTISTPYGGMGTLEGDEALGFMRGGCNVDE